MNHYDVLEVSHKASAEVIRAAYKSLMQRYHPDKNSGLVDKARDTARITQAYEVLSDEGKRAAYDLELAGAVAGASVSSSRGKSIVRIDLCIPYQKRQEPVLCVICGLLFVEDRTLKKNITGCSRLHY